MANAFIISSPSTASTIAVFNNVRRAYDGILAMNLSERSQRANPLRVHGDHCYRSRLRGSP